MKKIISISFLLIGLFLVSCKKDKDKSRMELITSASWKYDNAQVDQDQNGTPDLPLPPGVIDDCETDNVVTLKNDGSGTVDEGGSKCDMGDPQSVDITWSFKENETVINIPTTAFGPISGDAKILELTGTRLRLMKELSITDPIPMTVNIILDLKH